MFGDVDNTRTTTNTISRFPQGDRVALVNIGEEFHLLACDIPWMNKHQWNNFNVAYVMMLKDLRLTFPLEPNHSSNQWCNTK